MNRDQHQLYQLWISNKLFAADGEKYAYHEAAAEAILDAIEDISRAVVAEAFKAVSPPAAGPWIDGPVPEGKDGEAILAVVEDEGMLILPWDGNEWGEVWNHRILRHARVNMPKIEEDEK